MASIMEGEGSDGKCDDGRCKGGMACAYVHVEVDVYIYDCDDALAKEGFAKQCNILFWKGKRDGEGVKEWVEISCSRSS
jgi:hypothetical protein